jgi:hypothetical protein
VLLVLFLSVLIGLGLGLGLTLRRVNAPIAALDWQVAVNNGVDIPGTSPENEGRMFNSYNPPSVTTGDLSSFVPAVEANPLFPVVILVVR